MDYTSHAAFIFGYMTAHVAPNEHILPCMQAGSCTERHIGISYASWERHKGMIGIENPCQVVMGSFMFRAQQHTKHIIVLVVVC